MLQKVEREDLLKGKVFAFLIKVLLDLNSELFPMAITHGFVSQRLDQRDSADKVVDSFVLDFGDLPLLDLFGQGIELEHDVVGGVFHQAELELVESDVLPGVPLLVPILLDVPNVEQCLVLFLDNI